MHRQNDTRAHMRVPHTNRKRSSKQQENLTRNPSIPTLYICVERHLEETVKEFGFTTRSRENVAVETSPEKAEEGYYHHHTGEFSIFCVLPSPNLTPFCNKNGSWRISNRHIRGHIPPACLEQVFPPGHPGFIY